MKVKVKVPIRYKGKRQEIGKVIDIKDEELSLMADYVEIQTEKSGKKEIVSKTNLKEDNV